MSWSIPLVLSLAAFGLSAAATRWVLGWLRHRQILDHPNERSSHSRPTPRGGGLALSPVIILAWTLLSFWGSGVPGATWVLPGALIMLALSWADDRRGLSARLRLFVHVAVCLTGLAALGPEQLVFQGLLAWELDRAVTALAWIWFINLFNFMDGIDGISGVQAVSLGLGLGLVAMLGGQDSFFAPGLTLAAAAAGFLVWNWHPARLFLGDSGSVPLGYLLGWLLILAAIDGFWAAALILPLYYLADATITITRRMLRGEKVLQAHRQHFYQRAVAAGARHDHVALAVAGCNVALFAWACLSLTAPIAAIIGAAATVAVFLTALGWRARQALNPERL